MTIEGWLRNRLIVSSALASQRSRSPGWGSSSGWSSRARPDHEAVLVREVEEDLLGALAAPVPDHGQVSVVLDPEVGLEPLAADPLHGLVEGPVAPLQTTRVPLTRITRKGAVAASSRKRTAGEPSPPSAKVGTRRRASRQGWRGACRSPAGRGGRGGQLEAVHGSLRVEGRQPLGDLPNAEASGLHVRGAPARVEDGQLQVLEVGLAVPVRPPEAGAAHCAAGRSRRGRT